MANIQKMVQIVTGNATLKLKEYLLARGFMEVEAERNSHWMGSDSILYQTWTAPWTKSRSRIEKGLYAFGGDPYNCNQETHQSIRLKREKESSPTTKEKWIASDPLLIARLLREIKLSQIKQNRASRAYYDSLKEEEDRRTLMASRKMAKYCH